MEKPITLKEFISQNKEHYDIIKKTVLLCQEILHWKHEKICAVCDKELSDAEISATESSDFHHCCSEHAEYRKYFLLDSIRNKLGYGEQIYITIE